MLRVAVWLRWLTACALLSIGLSSPAWAQVAGKDFQPINPPQPSKIYKVFVVGMRVLAVREERIQLISLRQIWILAETNS